MANLGNYDNNTFYLAFKDVHPSWSLIGIAGIYAIIPLIGNFLNFSVIFITIKTKKNFWSLNGTANYLLALCSLFELLSQLGHFLFVYNAFSGQNFIECRLAAKILFIPLIGIGAIAPAMFFTGVDRLIGIAFSEFHDNIKKRLYLALLTILSVSFGLYYSVSEYQNAISDGDQMVLGSYGGFLKNVSLFSTISVLLISMTFIIYICLGIVIRIKASGLPSADSVNRRTFRALFLINIVNVGGYWFSAICYLLLIPTISSPITAWFCTAITSIPVTIGAVSNGPILYFTSTDYRQAFQTEFPFVFRRISNQNQVIPLQNTRFAVRRFVQSSHFSRTFLHYFCSYRRLFVLCNLLLAVNSHNCISNHCLVLHCNYRNSRDYWRHIKRTNFVFYKYGLSESIPNGVSIGFQSNFKSKSSYSTAE